MHIIRPFFSINAKSYKSSYAKDNVFTYINQKIYLSVGLRAQLQDNGTTNFTWKLLDTRMCVSGISIFEFLLSFILWFKNSNYNISEYRRSFVYFSICAHAHAQMKRATALIFGTKCDQRESFEEVIEAIFSKINPIFLNN